MMPHLVNCLVALLSIGILAASAARAETDLPDIFVALTSLEELEERGAAAWTDAEAEAYFGARAVIDAQLRRDPGGSDARAWFAGRLVDPESGAEYGWLSYGPATLAAIAGRAETLAMDRALWFAELAVAPWGISMLDLDPCLAVKAFALQGAADLSPEDAQMARAIPAAAEAVRLHRWSLNEYRAAVISSRPHDQEAVDRAELISQIIGEMLINGTTHLATLQEGSFFDPVFARRFAEVEVAEAFAALDEEMRVSIAAARPFFFDLQALFALPPDQAVARLCR